MLTRIYDAWNGAKLGLAGWLVYRATLLIWGVTSSLTKKGRAEEAVMLHIALYASIGDVAMRALNPFTPAGKVTKHQTPEGPVEVTDFTEEEGSQEILSKGFPSSGSAAKN